MPIDLFIHISRSMIIISTNGRSSKYIHKCSLPENGELQEALAVTALGS